jgi:predicted branched-subunit amino acid permease
MQIVTEEKPVEQIKEYVVDIPVPYMKSVPDFNTQVVKPKFDKPKNWMLLKIPILIYLTLLYGAMYVCGTAIGIYTKNVYAVYAVLGLHTIFVVLFILLMLGTRRTNGAKNK